jgi:hypothetical protein
MVAGLGGLVEQQICVLACSALGETGGIVFALLAFVWGLYQRRAKVRVDGQNTALELERAKLEAERAKLANRVEVLSLRPPAMPAQFVITAAAVPPVDPPATTTTESYADDAIPDERLD